jgi:glycosidase
MIYMRTTSTQLLTQLLTLFLAFALSLGCDDTDDSTMMMGGADLPPLSGEQAGDQVDDPAGAQTNPNAGEQAGDLAGESSGEQAGEQAGETSGEQAGELAGEQAGDIPSPIELITDGEVNQPWPHPRTCAVTLSYRQTSAQRVQVAGSFTGWGDAPLVMERNGDEFTISLTANEGPSMLLPGERYPYKLIVDGQWMLDPDNTLQGFDGDCLNSAFEVPRCDTPDVDVTRIEVQVAEPSDGDAEATSRGQVSGSLSVSLPADAEQLARFELMLDGEMVSFYSDPERGEISFDIDQVSEGKHWLSARAIDNQGRESVTRRAAFWVERRSFDWRDTPMYMLLVDRFANGDPSNDALIGDPVQYNADWHGGDLQGAKRALDSGYFEALGVRAIWLSPINLQVEGHFSDRIGAGRRFSAYHGYWPISGRQIDPRYGGDQGLREFIAAAHARGIRVLLDLINNQIHQEHEYYRDHPDWFRTGCVCGIDDGCGWSERPLDCLFASYLPDINWRVPGAERQFVDDALYWIDEFDVDGFRVDAVKHVETTSIYNLRAALAERFEGDGSGEPIWMFGETAVGEGDQYNDGCGVYYSDGYQWIDAYTGPRALNGQFDFPTHHRLRWQLLSGEGSFWDVDAALNDAASRYHPRGLHVRFLGSHDSSRVASEAARDPRVGCRYDDQEGCAGRPTQSSDPAVYDRLKRAWLLLWTTPGTPLLYYGDELAMSGANDPDSRRDMPWTGALSDLAMAAPGQTPEEASELQIELRSWLESLAALRQRFTSMTRGDRITLWIDADYYVYARLEERPEGVEVSVIALNQSEESQVVAPPLPDELQVIAGISRPEDSTPHLGQGEAQLNLAGDALEMTLPPRAASVWVWSTFDTPE